MHEHNKNINKEVENIRKNQADIWVLNKLIKKFTRGVQKQVDMQNKES